MHLVYINGGNHYDAFNAVLSWAIVVGACYGCGRLVWDVLRVAGWFQMSRADRAELDEHRRAAEATTPSAEPPPAPHG